MIDRRVKWSVVCQCSVACLCYYSLCDIHVVCYSMRTYSQLSVDARAVQRLRVDSHRFYFSSVCAYVVSDVATLQGRRIAASHSHSWHRWLASRFFSPKEWLGQSARSETLFYSPDFYFENFSPCVTPAGSAPVAGMCELSVGTLGAVARTSYERTFYKLHQCNVNCKHLSYILHVRYVNYGIFRMSDL